MPTNYQSVKIASGATGVTVDLFNDQCVGYFCPSALTGTLALKAVNPSTGTAVAINGFTSTFAASEYVPVGDDLRGVRQLNIDTGSAEGADRVFILALKEQ